MFGCQVGGAFASSSGLLSWSSANRREPSHPIQNQVRILGGQTLIGQFRSGFRHWYRAWLACFFCRRAVETRARRFRTQGLLGG